MDGRWTINQMKMGLGWNASVGGPITNDLPMPVVPCDDAAIERAARSIEDEVKARCEWYGLDNWSFTEVAEWILRAAGETP